MWRHHLRDVYQKLDFWTYYISSKFYCDCLNILELTKRGGGGGGGGRGGEILPGLKRSKKACLIIELSLGYTAFAISFCKLWIMN